MKNLHTILLLSMISSLIVIMFAFSEELHLKFHQEIYLSNNKLEKAMHPKRNNALLFIDSRYQPLEPQAKPIEQTKKEPEVNAAPAEAPKVVRNKVQTAPMHESLEEIPEIPSQETLVYNK